MMSKLSDGITEIKSELEVFKNSSGSNTATKEYGLISEKLEGIPNSIEKIVGEFQILSFLNTDKARRLDSGEVVELAMTKRKFDLFEAHWQETDMEARQGNQLVNFVNAFESLLTNLSENNKNIWSIEVNKIKRKFIVEEHLLEAQLSLESEAVERARCFKEAIGQFQQKTKGIPKDRGEIEDIQTLATQLKNLGSSMHHDVPVGVLRFMEASKTGAQLELLTEEVIAYLGSKKASKDYVIVRKSMYR